MEIYKRDIDKKLLSLRLSFFIIATVGLISFKYHYENLGYFIAVVIITLSIIILKGLVVYSDSFIISKYYFFGLFTRTWEFKKGEKIKVSSLGSDFGKDGDIPDIEQSAFWLGCLFSIFSIFIPQKITRKEFKIEKFNETNKLTKSVSIIIDHSESNYLKEFIT